MRPRLMTSTRYFAVTLVTASAMLWAQDQPGGWRRVTDQPPAPPLPEAGSPAQDPAQPVERTPVDAWGNPQQRNDRPPAAMRDDGAPPSYGMPAELSIKPGTFVTVRMSQMLSSD